MDSLTKFLIPVPAIIISLIIYVIFKFEKKNVKRRNLDMKSFASIRGFSFFNLFIPNGEIITSQLEGGMKEYNKINRNNNEIELTSLFPDCFELFHYGYDRYAYNCMTWDDLNYEIHLFDYYYTINRENIYVQTVLKYQFKNNIFPEFKLNPKNYLQKFISIFIRAKDFFPMDSKFSKKFILYHDSDDVIKKIFNVDVLQILNSSYLEGITIESFNENIIFYKSNKIINVKKLGFILDEAKKIIDLFYQNLI